jgi:hypothetical protein
MKYWKTLGPVSPPLFLYAANEGILVESWAPLKGLSKEEAEALRVCSAVQPALATGNWWAVHERAIARVVLARAGIVDADAGRWSMEELWWCSSTSKFWQERRRRSQLPHGRRRPIGCDVEQIGRWAEHQAQRHHLNINTIISNVLWSPHRSAVIALIS